MGRDIVVIGGGIIGTCTAYYLTRSSKWEEGDRVTIVEGSKIAAGASGKAGGLLALDWHGVAGHRGGEAASLAELSYGLHASLAEEHGGSKRWGYRTVNTLSVKIHPKKLGMPPKRKSAEGLTCSWLDDDITSSVGSIGSHESTSQVHPELFTTSLAELAQEKGAKVVYATVTDVRQAGQGFEVVASARDGGEDILLPATDVVVTAGPWSGALVKKLFGPSGRASSIVGSRAHSVVVRPAEGRTLPAEAAFLAVPIWQDQSPEIYCRPDGTAYVCGPTDPAPLPALASDVKVDESLSQSLLDQLEEISPRYLSVGSETPATVLVRQACYLPVGVAKPIIGKITGAPKGVYVCSGHTCWGICNGPGSGKVMSELILDGKVTSADISALQD